MELRHLRYFVVVAEEQNVTRAALRLHVSQPPLSRQIRDLEEELGVELFRRTAKSLALTNAGKLFLPEARAILLHVDQAVQKLRVSAKGDRGQLRVGYAPSLTVEFLPPALQSFEQTHPGVRVSLHDLSTEESALQLKARKIDVALVVQPARLNLRGLVFEKIISYPVCGAVATSHPLAKKRTVALSEFRKEPLMAYSREEYPEYLDWLRKIFRPLGFVPELAEEYDSATSLIAAVEAGRGIALVPSSMRCFAGPRLKLIPLTQKLPALAVGALYTKPPVRWVDSFIAIVRKTADKLPAPL